MSLLSRSLGSKRYIAAALMALASILEASPETVFLLPLVDKLAAIFGVVGISHAAKSGSILKAPKLSAAAIFSILVAAADQIPALAPYLGLIHLIGSLLGLTAVSLSSLPRSE